MCPFRPFSLLSHPFAYFCPHSLTLYHHFRLYGPHTCLPRSLVPLNLTIHDVFHHCGLLLCLIHVLLQLSRLLFHLIRPYFDPLPPVMSLLLLPVPHSMFARGLIHLLVSLFSICACLFHHFCLMECLFRLISSSLPLISCCPVSFPHHSCHLLCFLHLLCLNTRSFHLIPCYSVPFHLILCLIPCYHSVIHDFDAKHHNSVRCLGFHVLLGCHMVCVDVFHEVGAIPYFSF